ncbi:succinate dehydrogenase / fumarate reductase flavoprotein subunit [Microbacterium sp. SORGH_AS454]|nr:succinate dehydrogenase / fumarate reductase flavoprotein subunit [Microbacterium sp. SORGH_AS_0454]
MGLPFNRTPEGKIDQRRFGGHTADHGKTPVRRACYAADRTGHMILQTLFQNCVKLGINFFNEFYVLDLVTVKDAAGKTQVAGVVAYDLATGELHVFQSKAVIFATGGFGKIFKTTSNAHTLTGDGVGIVWRKGLPLEDMEFFQFHPTGLAGLGILLTEGARGEGAILRNASGERFMERYAPTIKDLAPRDIVARCMVQEVAEGRGAGPHRDYVLLDCTHLGAEVLETKLPDITEFARTYLGVDPVVEPVPVMPTAHYAMGGIPTNIKAEVLADNDTVVPGLYAAGECACVSVHGSNRLGTNSLLDINVFGKRAGRNAVEYVKTADFVPLPEDPAAEVRGLIEGLRSNSGTERIAVLRKTLQDEMDKGAQVFRTHESLAHVMDVIADLRERYKNIHVDDKGKRFNTDLLEAVELGFLLDLAEVVVYSAQNREESRGGHMRDDFPTRDDENYMQHTMAYLSGDPHSSHPADHIELGWKPVVFTKNEAGELRYPPLERKY